MMDKKAHFSPGRQYRYSLHRIWDTQKPYVLFICLNPSTADENNDDPTVRRCIRYAAGWGYGGLVVANIFAYRSTDPAALLKIDDPIGPENDQIIKVLNSQAGLTVAAWGNHGKIGGRGAQVMRYLHKPHYLTFTIQGQPGHPLYLKKDLQPQPFPDAWICLDPRKGKNENDYQQTTTRNNPTKKK